MGLIVGIGARAGYDRYSLEGAPKDLTDKDGTPVDFKNKADGLATELHSQATWPVLGNNARMGGRLGVSGRFFEKRVFSKDVKLDEPECEKYDTGGYASGNSGDAASCDYGYKGKKSDPDTSRYNGFQVEAMLLGTWNASKALRIVYWLMPDEITAGIGGSGGWYSPRAQAQTDETYGPDNLKARLPGLVLEGSAAWLTDFGSVELGYQYKGGKTSFEDTGGNTDPADNKVPTSEHTVFAGYRLNLDL